MEPQSTQCKSVVIGKCDPSVSLSYIYRHLERFGDVDSVFMFKTKYAKVTFHSTEATNKCYLHYKTERVTKIPYIKTIEIHFDDTFNGDRTVIEIYPCNYVYDKTVRIASNIVTNSVSNVIFINKCGNERMCLLKGINAKICKQIDAERKKKSFESMDDLMNRVKSLEEPNINAIEKTISFLDPSLLLVSRYCSERPEFIRSHNIIDIIQNYFDHIVIAENSDIFAEERSISELQKKFKEFALPYFYPSEQYPKKESRTRQEPERRRVVCHGINSGYVYDMYPYKSNERWKRLKCSKRNKPVKPWRRFIKGLW